ncbi:MAG: hypothetical protein WCQ72_05785 [Eubacteriales bacterium]
MDFRGNNKYFRFYNPIAMIIGVVFIAIGVALTIMMDFDPYFGIGPAIVGIVLIVFDLGRRTKDSDINSQVDREIKDQTFHAQETLGIDDKKIRLHETFEYREYSFDDPETLLVKRGGDGKYRTSVFCASEVFLTTVKMFIHSKTFSLIEDKKSESTIEIPYEQLDEVSIENLQFTKSVNNGKETYNVEYSHMHIKRTDGSEVVINVSHDAAVDNSVMQINHYIANRREELEKKQSGT